MPTLLLAEDDRVVLFTLADGLREAGFEVIEARDGARALELCKSELPDLALLDIRMPGLDGLELARRLRAETSTPFLFFTAYDDEDLVRRAVKLGALGYLVKPLDVPRIVPMLRAALARAEEADGLRAALESNRDIGTAVGIAMRTWNLDRAAAFERLRKHARDRSKKLIDVAREVVETGTCPTARNSH